MNDLFVKLRIFLFRGRAGGVFLLYFVVGMFEIYCTINTNVGGELNLYGWVSAILGLIVAAPWFWLYLYAHTQLGLSEANLSFNFAIITSVIFNIWLIYKFSYDPPNNETANNRQD